MSHTAIGVVVPSVIPCCSSCGTSWRRQDSNLRLRGYEPRGLTELPYSAPAPEHLGIAAGAHCGGGLSTDQIGMLFRAADWASTSGEHVIAPLGCSATM